MTTANSPVSVLREQANKIASSLKSLTPNGKPSLKFAVGMDDKILTIEMSWEKLKDTDSVALAEFILKQMQGKQDN